jgi:hypothetical protein
VALAGTFEALGKVLQIISTLIKAWELLQAATVVWTVVSFFTAGAGLAVAGDTEEASIEVRAGIEAARLAAQEMLRAAADGLIQQIPDMSAGSVLGTVAGISVGVVSAREQHETGWHAAHTIVGDAWTGTQAGSTAADNPVAMAGTVIGLEEVASQNAAHHQPLDVQAEFDKATDYTQTVSDATDTAGDVRDTADAIWKSREIR